MAKKKSWFGWVKKLFTCKEKTKIAKDWRWNLGRVEVRQYPALLASQRTLSLCEAEEEQKKHALNVAMATAAAAKAAVAAAEAAAEIVLLTGAASGSCKRFSKMDLNSAATKIQSAYRAHLAKKALRALKGVVRLQAIARGRAVRRQTFATLNRLRSNRIRIPEAHQSVVPARDQLCYKNGQKKELFLRNMDFEEKEHKFESSSQGEWDCSTLSIEDIETIWLKRQEAAMKRERMKKYLSSHRERSNSNFTLQDSLTKKESRAQSARLEGQATSKPIASRSNPNNNNETHNKLMQVKQKITRRRESLEGTSTEFPLSRNSFALLGEIEGLMPSSPVFVPSYMASTESAQAKKRSMSIPKQRVGFWDGCLNGNDPQKHRLSLWSSYDGESFLRN